MKPIDTGALKDNLTDIFGDEDRLVCLKDVLDLIDEQPALTQPNEWISVEDRLPPNKTRCLVVDMNGLYAPNYYLSVYNKGFYVGNSFVTHWMPLPAPPDSRPPEGEEDT